MKLTDKFSGVKVFDIINRYNIETVEQAQLLTDEQLLKCRHVGPLFIKKLRDISPEQPEAQRKTFNGAKLMKQNPDFEKAAREQYPEYWEDAERYNAFLAGCEHAYAIGLAEANYKLIEQLEALEKENKELKKQQKLANDYILALNDYHESIHGRDIRCDQSLYNKAQKAGEDYADSLESGK